MSIFKKKCWVPVIAALMLILMSTPAFGAADNKKTELTEVTEEVLNGGQDITVTETVETEEPVADPGIKAIMAVICVASVACAGAVGMCIVTSRAEDNIAKQPESSGNIQGAMMLGLVFLETAIIYALIVAILVIFVL